MKKRERSVLICGSSFLWAFLLPVGCGMNDGTADTTVAEKAVTFFGVDPIGATPFSTRPAEDDEFEMDLPPE